MTTGERDRSKGEQIAEGADEAGRRLDESDAFQRVVRVGLLAYAAVHVLVAVVAVRLAVGRSSGSGQASSDGALSQLAGAPLGTTMLVVMAAGFLALVLSRLLEAAYSHRDEEGVKRYVMPVYSSLKALLYGTLAWSSAKVALSSSSGGGGGGGGGGQTDTLTAQVMALPAGQVLVVAVGVAVWAYAAGLLRTGITSRYRDKLSAEGWQGDAGSTYDTIAKVGYIGKGAAFVLVGLLFVVSGVTHDAEQSGGLDQALRELLGQPYGRIAVLAVAVGLGAYGVFAIVRARHLRHRS